MSIAQPPCITSEMAEKVSDETYKIDVTINPVEMDGECQITMLGLAKSESVTTRLAYKAKHIDTARYWRRSPSSFITRAGR